MIGGRHGCRRGRRMPAVAVDRGTAVRPTPTIRAVQAAPVRRVLDYCMWTQWPRTPNTTRCRHAAGLQDRAVTPGPLLTLYRV
jgi:hypothetical protein